MRYSGLITLLSAILWASTMMLHAQDSTDDLKLLSEQVQALYRAGRFDEAVVIARQALELAEKQAGSGHSYVTASLNSLAFLYHTQGRYADAEPLYRRALTIREEELGPDHPDVAQSLNNLAALYYHLGRYADAEPLYERALAIREKAFGPEHPFVAQSLNDLAELYRTQGRYADAEPLYERALAIREKAFGPDHPDVAQSLNNLAGLYHSQHRYADAEPLYERALAIWEKVLGPDHPQVALSLNNLAALYYQQGRFADAEPLYKRALIIREKVFGPEHPDVAQSLNNLACLYHSQERYTEAEPLFERALLIREKTIGPNHPHVIQNIENLVRLYRATGQSEKAETLERRIAGSMTAPGDVVGACGNLNTIEIIGSETFTPEDILKGMRSNPELFILSHPMVHKDAFMNGLIRLTTLGYRQAGFPYAKVSARESDSGDHVILNVEEGKRFTTGKVMVSGLETIPEEAVIDWLTKPSRDISFMADKPSAEQTAGADHVSFDVAILDKKVSHALKPETHVWEPGKPAKCTDMMINTIRMSLANFFAEHGLFFPEMDVSFEFDENSKQVALNIAVHSEGPPGVIGNIEIVGLKNHSREELLEYLDLREGQIMNRDMLLAAERRLMDSGRFISVNLAPRPLEEQGERLKLSINLQEAGEVPKLAAPLSEVEEACLNFGEWVRGLSEGREDVRIRFSYYETNMVTIAVSATQGIVAVVSDTGFTERTGSHVQGGLLLGSGSAELLRAPDEPTLWADAQKSELTLKVSLTPPGTDPEQKGRFFAGGGMRSGNNVESGVRFDIDIPSSFFLWLADTTNAVVELDDSLLKIKMKKLDLELEYDCGTHRLKPVRYDHPELPSSMAIEVDQGLFNQTCRAFTQSSDGERAQLSGMVLIGAAITRILALVSDMPAIPEDVAQPVKRAVDTLSVFVDAGKALPLKKKNGDEDRNFIIPLKPEYAQNMLLWVMTICYGQLSDMLPEDSWPVVVARETAMMSAGQPNYLYGSLRSLLAGDNMGPAGCLILSQLSGLFGPVAAGEFAHKGLDLLSEDEFSKDVDLVVQMLDSRGVLDPANGYLDAVDWSRLAEAVAETVTDSEERRRCLEEIRALQEAPAEERLDRLGQAMWRGWDMEDDLERDLNRAVAENLCSQASLYQSQGRYADAEPLCERALAIRENVLGPDHPEVAENLESLALLYRATDRNEEADALETRAAQIRAMQE